MNIVLPIARVGCAACQTLRQVEIGFADRRRSYTKSFERYALDLLRHTTIQDVAEHLNVGWDLVKDIQKRDLTRLRDLCRCASRALGRPIPSTHPLFLDDPRDGALGVSSSFEADPSPWQDMPFDE